MLDSVGVVHRLLLPPLLRVPCLLNVERSRLLAVTTLKQFDDNSTAKHAMMQEGSLEPGSISPGQGEGARVLPNCF